MEMYCEIRFKDKKKRVDYIANGENGKLKISYPDCDRLGFRTIAEARNAVAFYGEGEIYDMKGVLRN